MFNLSLRYLCWTNRAECSEAKCKERFEKRWDGLCEDAICSVDTLWCVPGHPGCQFCRLCPFILHGRALDFREINIYREERKTNGKKNLNYITRCSFVGAQTHTTVFVTLISVCNWLSCLLLFNKQESSWPEQHLSTKTSGQLKY